MIPQTVVKVRVYIVIFMVSQLEVFWNFQAFFAELATPTAAHNPSEFGGATHIT